MTGPRLTSGRCRCAACGDYFTSTRSFDRHRMGAYAKPGKWRGERRCLTVVELLARGWQKSARGFWLQLRPQRAPAGTQGPYATPPAGVVGGSQVPATNGSGRG